MNSQKVIVGELLMIALSIGALIAGLVGLLMWAEGAFTLLWYGRAIFGFGLIVLLAGLLILPRILRTSPVRGPLTTWRRADKMPACSFALLLGLVAAGLLLCGGVMDLLGQK